MSTQKHEQHFSRATAAARSLGHLPFGSARGPQHHCGYTCKHTIRLTNTLQVEVVHIYVIVTLGPAGLIKTGMNQFTTEKWV